MNAEQIEQQATEIITTELMRLPRGVQSGTAKQLVRLLVDAAVARIAEQKPAPSKPQRPRA